MLLQHNFIIYHTFPSINPHSTLHHMTNVFKNKNKTFFFLNMIIMCVLLKFTLLCTLHSKPKVKWVCSFDESLTFISPNIRVSGLGHKAPKINQLTFMYNQLMAQESNSPFQFIFQDSLSVIICPFLSQDMPQCPSSTISIPNRSLE